jgi:hypothetical protein
LKKLIQIIALALLSAGAHAAPLTVVAGTNVLKWPRTIAEEIGDRQRGTGTIFYVDVVRTTNVTRAEWAESFAAATSIHFIGIGRGAGMLATLAGQFPEVKIDQMTTIAGDTDHVPANVIFADNYFAFLVGAFLPGAFNFQPELTNYVSQDSPLAAWYFGTIYDKHSNNGYTFADCDHGVRPLEGFRARRVGRPQLIQVSASAQIVSGGASGQYFLDASKDLKSWTLGTEAMILDGQPSRSAPVSLANVPPGSPLFFRLRSVAASF